MWSTDQLRFWNNLDGEEFITYSKVVVKCNNTLISEIKSFCASVILISICATTEDTSW